MSIYDKYYMDLNYFGKPYNGLIEYFEKANKGTLVDLGAGQGRDSIPLARMGYDVTAVDISSVGLKQMTEIQPNIKTISDDLYSFDVSSFDYILMDSIVHFYKSDLEKETALIRRILSEMKQDAIFVNCLLKNKKSEKTLKTIVSEFDVQILEDTYVEYPEFDAQYHLFVGLKR